MTEYNKRVNKDSFKDFFAILFSNQGKEHNENQIIYEASMDSIDIQTYFNEMINDELIKLKEYKDHTVKIYYRDNN